MLNENHLFFLFFVNHFIYVKCALFNLQSVTMTVWLFGFKLMNKKIVKKLEAHQTKFYI